MGGWVGWLVGGLVGWSVGWWVQIGSTNRVREEGAEKCKNWLPPQRINLGFTQENSHLSNSRHNTPALP